MADITFYFDQVAAAPHDCAYSDYWDNTSQAERTALNTSKGTSAIENRTCYRTNGQHLGCGAQFVSAAQSARSYTTADTFEFTICTYDVNETAGSTLALSIRVFNAAGDTEVGVLYEGVVNAVNWIGSIISRHADGVAFQNSVDMPEGGHLVIEIGMHEEYAGSLGNRVFVGEGTSAALPLSDADTDSDKYPWLAFTYGAAATENNVLFMTFES